MSQQHRRKKCGCDDCVRINPLLAFIAGPWVDRIGMWAFLLWTPVTTCIFFLITGFPVPS